MISAIELSFGALVSIYQATRRHTSENVNFNIHHCENFQILYSITFVIQGEYKILNIKKGKLVPLQAWTGPEGSSKLRFPDFVTTAQDGGKVVSLTHRPPLPPRKYSRYSFLIEAESTPGPKCDREDFMSMKNPLTPAGIEPATLRFVAQHLNQ